MVRTDGLVLSAMGTMDKSGGPGGSFGGPGGGGRPEFGRGTENRPEGPLGPSGQPGAVGMELSGEGNLSQALLLLGVCVLVLAAGIMTAWQYRRRGRRSPGGAGRPVRAQENSACCRR